jgi:ATP-binding cassette, subfamily B, bacterial MsbA
MAYIPNMQGRSTMTSKQLYLRLLTYVRPHWRIFVIAIGCMGLSAVVEPIFPALMKNLLDDGFASTQAEWDWLVYPLGIVAVFVGRAILGFIGDYAMSWVSNKVVLELRREMFDRIMTLPVRYFGENLSGRLVTYDVNGVAGAATEALTNLVKDSLSIVGLMAWLFYLNWQLTLVTVAMVPFIALAVGYFGKRLRKIARGLQESQGTLTQVLQEMIEGYKVIKIFGGQTYESDRFRQAAETQRRLNMRGKVASATQGPIVQFFAALALATIMGVALHQASTDKTTVGSFVSFITAMLMVLAPLKRLTDVNAPIQQGLAAAESVFGLIDEKSEEDTGTEILSGDKTHGEVVFDQVSFQYPDTERPALDGVSFTIQPGESVALVGQSGSGKTTIANMLPRFYHATGGEIRVDGLPLEKITLESLRDNIALVSQEVVLFNDTIAANIAYGSRRDSSVESIRAAAIAAHALEFIEKLPDGFDTLVGEHGVKLSGGQRQRLAIARAILKNSPILILDEATSALDTESERHVQAALDELMRGRTTLVIAHRLSTIERADRILVLSQGKVIESGSHAELLAKEGAYSRLHSLQRAAEMNA